MTLHVNEYGRVIRLMTNFDLSANTGLLLSKTAKSGDTINLVPTLGTTPLDIGNSMVVAANSYVNYTIKYGDFSEVGMYRLKLIADFGSGKRLISNEAYLNVLQ
jgi:hypothetical protein